MQLIAIGMLARAARAILAEVTMNILVILHVLYAFPACLQCLKITIDGGTILDRPILTSALSAGFGHLIKARQYGVIAELLRFRSFDFKPAYYSVIKQSEKRLIVKIYDAYNNGFLCKEDARTLLPSDLVSSNLEMEKLNPTGLAKLPNHPFSGVQHFCSYHMSEDTLIAALHRGLQERDPEMNWTAWPSNTPLRYDLVWDQPELWRSLLNEMFCDSKHAVKQKMIFTLKKSIERAQSLDDLIMINLTIVTFFFELCRMAKQLQESKHIYPRYFGLNIEFESLFKAIKDHPIAKAREDLFKDLDLNSSKFVYNSKERESVQLNSFYYEERIELFVKVLERLKRIPDVFADWFINFLTAFFDVVPKMSLKLLSDTWTLFLSFKPTIRSICTLMSWLQDRIKEDYRFQLAKMIPSDLILLFYRKCPTKNVPSPTSLISYNIRKSEYLRINRMGSFDLFTYNLSSFWTPKHTNLVKLLKVFQLMKTGWIDLFESIDIVFILDSKEKEVGLKKFLETILEMFLSIKEWTMLVSSDVDILIPSALFPPSFGPLLAQLIVRCRHLNCSAPFKICESYFILSALYISVPETTKLNTFVQCHINYLSQSDGSRLPRLSIAYKMYFSIIASYVEPNESESPDLDEEDFNQLFFEHHLLLFRLMNHLKLEASLEAVPLQVTEIEPQIHEILTKTLLSFGREIRDLLTASPTFKQEEIYSFLYN